MTTARDLSARLAELLRREQHAMADFLVTLADFDRERLWVELGYSSIFYFLHRELGLSKGAAQYRKTAAELIQRFPSVIEPLRDGRLCITSIVELARVITPENYEEVLPRFFHLSKREATEVVAELRPVAAPPVRDVITSVPGSAPAPRDLPAASVPVNLRLRDDGAAVRLADLTRANSAAAGVATLSQPVAPVDAADPLTANVSRLHVTVSHAFLEKLEAARAALSHAKPTATTEEILTAGLDLLLAKHARSKGIVAKPRSHPPPSEIDHIPAHVKRAVWTRDGGRCQWPLASGGICGCTKRVQFAHRDPRARGGPATVENLRLLWPSTTSSRRGSSSGRRSWACSRIVLVRATTRSRSRPARDGSARLSPEHLERVREQFRSTGAAVARDDDLRPELRDAPYGGGPRSDVGVR
jgi:hypothetical protein